MDLKQTEEEKRTRTGQKGPQAKAAQGGGRKGESEKGGGTKADPEPEPQAPGTELVNPFVQHDMSCHPAYPHVVLHPPRTG